MIKLTVCKNFICNVYNMSGRVVSDIQTRAEGESLYIRYNTDANVVNNLKNDSSYKFIGEVILKINVVSRLHCLQNARGMFEAVIYNARLQFVA